MNAPGFSRTHVTSEPCGLERMQDNIGYINFYSSDFEV